MRVVLNPHYVIDMMKALIDLSPNKGMAGVEVIIDKTALEYLFYLKA